MISELIFMFENATKTFATKKSSNLRPNRAISSQIDR